MLGCIVTLLLVGTARVGRPELGAGPEEELGAELEEALVAEPVPQLSIIT